MKEFIGYIIGEGSIPLFSACLFFAYLLAGVMIIIDVKKRDKLSPETPVAFSQNFFWMDNILRIAANVILIYLAVRFLRGWLFGATLLTDGTYEEKNPEWQLIGSGLVGVVSDMLCLWLKKIKVLANQKVREKFKNVGLSDNENV